MFVTNGLLGGIPLYTLGYLYFLTSFLSCKFENHTLLGWMKTVMKNPMVAEVLCNYEWLTYAITIPPFADLSQLYC